MVKKTKVGKVANIIQASLSIAIPNPLSHIFYLLSLGMPILFIVLPIQLLDYTKQTVRSLTTTLVICCAVFRRHGNGHSLCILAATAAATR